MIVIIDYNMGNVKSIQNMLSKIGYDSKISSDPEDICNASRLILPGVGSFDRAMEQISTKELKPVLDDNVLNMGKPILGICLGMQILTKKSEEGKENGLGWIDAVCKKFDLSNFDEKLPIPHMGWNKVKILNKNKLFNNLDHNKFYFVHSYYVIPKFDENIITTTNYGIDFCSSINKKNIYGVQFHPEKSHKFGMQLLKNFCEI